MHNLAAVLKSAQSTRNARQRHREFYFRPGQILVTPKTATARYSRRYLNKAIEDSQRALFDALVREWDADTRWQSSMSVITTHPAFDKIKQMGGNAAKFILLRMKSGDVRLHWFPLLFDVAGIDPVPSNQRGMVPAMTAAWIKWGEDTGRI